MQIIKIEISNPGFVEKEKERKLSAIAMLKRIFVPDSAESYTVGHWQNRGKGDSE